jgi:hypothetical protein
MTYFRGKKKGGSGRESQQIGCAAGARGNAAVSVDGAPRASTAPAEPGDGSPDQTCCAIIRPAPLPAPPTGSYTVVIFWHCALSIAASGPSPHTASFLHACAGVKGFFTRVSGAATSAVQRLRGVVCPHPGHCDGGLLAASAALRRTAQMGFPLASTHCAPRKARLSRS